MAKKDKKKKGEEAKEEGAEEAKEEAKKEEPKEEAKEGGEAKEGEEGAAPEGEGAPKKGKRKLIFIIAGVLLLALIGGGAAMFLGGGGDEEGGEHGDAEHEEEVALDDHGNPIIHKPTYYELPEFLVNLTSTANRVSFLKMSVTLELKDETSVAIVDANKPRIINAFNVYLRELKASDVQGSAGIFRLRDELMTRINGTIEEGLVKDILFSEIIVQ